MNDDPSEVDVLYGKVLSSSWTSDIQAFADAMVDKLHKAGSVFFFKKGFLQSK